MFTLTIEVTDDDCVEGRGVVGLELPILGEGEPGLVEEEAVSSK